MLSLNLSSLGITEEALTKAVLKELGISREEAIKQLAQKLGVTLPEARSATVSNGARVATTEGEAVACVLTQADQAALSRAGEILSRVGAG